MTDQEHYIAENTEQFKTPLSTLQRLRTLASVFQNLGVSLFEYLPQEDLLLTYDKNLCLEQKYEAFLDTLNLHTKIKEKDRPKIIAILRGRRRDPVEIRIQNTQGTIITCMLTVINISETEERHPVVLGMLRDISQERQSRLILREKTRRDPKTNLYNSAYGQILIDRYLRTKNPFASCGLLVLDIDYFKNVNDTYGHLFGDTVLIELSSLFLRTFSDSSVILRAGGDEFVIFLKDISHTALIQQSTDLLGRVNALVFPENDCRITCSIGVCFLPVNTSGYTYNQLFGNADWALYRAKELGRNRCEFCDDLHRYELTRTPEGDRLADIDSRYLHNDIIATAFELFEKMNSFDEAIRLLMEIIGIRFQLDRITIIRTDIQYSKTGRQYMWLGPGVPEVLPTDASFTKEDFLTLFHSYDDNGTTVLDYDNLSMYSEDAQKLLMQGNAKTVVYAAMYCEGRYTGAISYVSCGRKRHWSAQQRSQFGELTKIISAYLAKNQAINATHHDAVSAPGFDTLTGLISFTRFREEVERVIVGRLGGSHVMIYTDFENFKYLNRKYGYQQGDLLLKEFSNYLLGYLPNDVDVYCTRVVADQFISFFPVRQEEDLAQEIHRRNEIFIRTYASQFPEITLRIRSGIYYIESDCHNASIAIDAANYARRQVTDKMLISACVYEKDFSVAQSLESEIINNMNDALRRREFKVYLQPKFSLKDRSVTGAEALVRWQNPDGTVLMPDSFVPLYERTHRIADLDYYVFEEVVAFLAKNNALGRRQVPISVNASVMHATDPNAVQRYLDILKKYHVDPSLTEIELTETATVSDYGNVVHLFRQLQKAKIPTSLDDFGAGYSVLNTVIDIPVNIVKIDRVFVNHCVTSQKGILFLKQLIEMIRGLGYRVLCEGIETEEQAQILLEAGCEEGQGFLFSRPLPISEYEAMMYGEEEKT